MSRGTIDPAGGLIQVRVGGFTRLFKCCCVTIHPASADTSEGWWWVFGVWRRFSVFLEILVPRASWQYQNRFRHNASQRRIDPRIPEAPCNLLYGASRFGILPFFKFGPGTRALGPGPRVAKSLWQSRCGKVTVAKSLWQSHCGKVNSDFATMTLPQ